MLSNKNRRSIITYVILVFAISSIFYFSIPKAGGIEGIGSILVLPLMWTPAIAAFLACIIHKENIRTFGWHIGKPIYSLIAYLLPILYAGLTYSIIWLSGLGEVDMSVLGRNPAQEIFHSLTIGLIPALFLALGEEIGWRGFLVPRLRQEMSYKNTALLSGMMWGIWHIPLIISGGYRSSAPIWYSILCFLILIIGISFVFTWIRLQSGSLWTAVILHATHNVIIQDILDRITIDKGITEFFTTEFGLGLAIMGFLLGIIFWKLEKKKPIRIEHSS